MNLITLNLWGGQIYEPLMAFLESHAHATDIFCFQEMLFGSQPEFTPVHKARMNLSAEIEQCLSGFMVFTYPAPPEADHFQSEPLPKNMQVGQAIFVKNSLAVTDRGSFRTYEKLPLDTVYGGKGTGNGQWVRIGDITILNVHGIWQQGTNKVDTPARIQQSQIINEFLRECPGKKIVCGDFNLIPTGEAMKTLEQSMENLITKFGIASTRSDLYTKPEKFADYVLVSPDIIVEDFSALQDVVSDHLPLRLIFK
jgi:hypothetical protein